MARAIAISVTVACLLTGCVSLGPSPTTQPSLGPSFTITTLAPIPSASATSVPTASPSATASPIEAATATPTEAPTVGAPTLGPSASPAPPLTPTPSTAVIEDFGADELLFGDDFSDPASGWGVGTNAGGSVAYTDGVLRFDTSGDEARLWSWPTPDDTWNVIRAEGVFVPSAAGSFGLICAISDEELFGAALNTDGGWFFFQLDSGVANILTSDPDADWNVPVDLATSVALDCAGTQTGPMRMQVSLPEFGVAAIFDGGEGPVGFDRVGVYAESSTHPWSLGVDNVFAYGGEGLLGHVPVDWRESCFATSPSASETGARATVSCQPSTGRSDVVDFVQFDTQESMDAAYQTRVDNWAVESTDSCETGPNETSYTIGGSPAGRILCAPQTVGIRFDWTHDDLLILSTLTDFEGSYANAYEDWLIAGPE